MQLNIGKKMKKTFFIIITLLVSAISIYAQTWEFVGLDSMVIRHLYISGDTIYAGTAHRLGNQDKSGLYFTSDGGNNWIQIDSTLGNGVILGLQVIPPSTLFILKGSCAFCVAGTIYKSPNNGKTWEIIDNISNNSIQWFGISPFNNNEIYAIDWDWIPGGIVNYLYKSIDGGDSWQGIGPFPGSSHGSRLTFAFDMNDSTSLFVTVNTGFSRHLFKSTDKGNNWFRISTPPESPVETRTDLFLPDRIYLFVYYKASDDGGLSWYDIDIGLPDQGDFLSFYMNIYHPNTLFNLRLDGIYLTKNDTINWKLLEASETLPLNVGNNGFHFGDIGQMTNLFISSDNNVIYAGTARGIFKTSLITNVEEEDVIELDYSLSQNYPNPFNPSTTIEYQIKRDSFVSLTVYDMLGNEIATLVNGEQPAGKYHLTFNAETIEKFNLASGIYIYQLYNGTNLLSQKMTYLK
jgi:photosystem II stability/assembly factor-like uncharacterized protein